MKTRITMARGLAMLAALALSQPAVAQAPAGLQEKLAAAKQAAAQSQQALRSYTWIEKTELSFKGEVKNTKIGSCRYGPDGKVQKSVVQEPPPAQKKPGLRGKIIEKKKEEMKEELEAATALVQQYVPPDRGLIQVVINAARRRWPSRGRASRVQVPRLPEGGGRADAHARLGLEGDAPDRCRNLHGRPVEAGDAAGPDGLAA